MGIREWHTHAAIYLALTLVGLPIFENLLAFGIPPCKVKPPPIPAPRRIFDCFLYHNEAYMLYLQLLTLSKYVDVFVIGHSNQSFTKRTQSPVSFSPFKQEIFAFSHQIVFLYIDLDRLPLSRSKWSNGTAWRREATARNHLIEGVKSRKPDPDDLIMLCDVDEIVTRSAISLIRQRPPVHYYNLQGLLFHYTFRWKVGEWERPLVIRYGSLSAPLDDYKFVPFLFPLPGVLHYHCSFCFPKMSEVFRKLKSFSHTEYSRGQFTDPNYVFARIACGYGIIPPRWKMPEKLTLVSHNESEIYLPKDRRFDFLRYRIGFKDLKDYQLTAAQIAAYKPNDCTLQLDPQRTVIGPVL
jgi:beta-1,4-mannosyl-glycoprotein beta-1,4-N-acetylglucosaminyltransferase